MKVLVINGAFLQVNSSANLCHLAYIRGLVEAGHEVTVLSADGADYLIDPDMAIPTEVQQVTFYAMSLYERLSHAKKHQSVSVAGPEADAPVQKASLKQKIVKELKKTALSLYGVHGIYMPFVRRAKRFKSDVRYDYVLSLSTPVTSHLLAHLLISSGHIMCRRWIQLWEDPWYSDAYGFNRRPEILAEEKRLLSNAEKVCYVSPITLINQKKLFPESAEKMFWQPLPSYYTGETDIEKANNLVYGYLGDYHSAVRDLAPFYEAARRKGIEVNICGNSNCRFESNEKIRIYPRLPLDQLKPIEQNTGVLVFLCNREGGQIPGKIYQYAATNKTILFILDGTEDEKGAIRNYFEPFNRFVFCENSMEDIERAIDKIQKKDLGEIINRPLQEFEPVKIVQRILDEGMQ